MSERNNNHIALAVDLDGTLLCGDMLHLSLWRLLTRNPLYLLCLPVWLLAGKAALKRQIARRVSVDPAQLQYHQEILAFVREQHAMGRRTVLASGSDQRLVAPVAEYLGCFDLVFASDGNNNRTGHDKQAMLVGEFGVGGYDYIGNSLVDIPVWQAAHQVLVAASSRRFSQAIERQFQVERVFWRQRSRGRAG